MRIIRYLIPLAMWLALILGALYLLVFLVLGGRENFAIATAMFALSLSIRAYGARARKPR